MPKQDKDNSIKPVTRSSKRNISKIPGDFQPRAKQKKLITEAKPKDHAKTHFSVIRSGQIP